MDTPRRRPNTPSGLVSHQDFATIDPPSSPLRMEDLDSWEELRCIVVEEGSPPKEGEITLWIRNHLHLFRINISPTATPWDVKAKLLMLFPSLIPADAQLDLWQEELDMLMDSEASLEEWQVRDGAKLGLQVRVRERKKPVKRSSDHLANIVQVSSSRSF